MCCGKQITRRPEDNFSLCKLCGSTFPIGSKGDTMNIWEYLGLLSVEEQTQKLEELLNYMRTTHLYCFYCGSRYDTKEQLDDMCPGLFEDSH